MSLASPDQTLWVAPDACSTHSADKSCFLCYCCCCRSDLEKAVSAHGGPSVVAQRLGWELRGKQRRPKGYWDAPANVRAELDLFIDELGLPPGGWVRRVGGGWVRRVRRVRGGGQKGAASWVGCRWRTASSTSRPLIADVLLRTPHCPASAAAAGVLPAKNDFVRAGRYDIARAVERWGGLYEVRGRRR